MEKENTGNRANIEQSIKFMQHHNPTKKMVVVSDHRQSQRNYLHKDDLAMNNKVKLPIIPISIIDR
jgi:hypothetical protein